MKHCRAVRYEYYTIIYALSSELPRSIQLVGGRSREGRGCETDTLITSVCGQGVNNIPIAAEIEELTEDAVEPLKEGHAVDEVETLATGSTNVVHHQVYTVGIAANCSVEGTLDNMCKCRNAITA